MTSGRLSSKKLMPTAYHSAMIYQVSQEKYRSLINNETQLLRLIFILFSVLNKAYHNLDFETKIAQIF